MTTGLFFFSPVTVLFMLFMSIRSLPFLTTVKNMDDGMDKFLMTTFIHVLCFSQVKLHLQMLVLNQLENIYVGPDQLLGRLLRIGDNVAHSPSPCPWRVRCCPLPCSGASHPALAITRAAQLPSNSHTANTQAAAYKLLDCYFIHICPSV